MVFDRFRPTHVNPPPPAAAHTASRTSDAALVGPESDPPTREKGSRFENGGNLENGLAHHKTMGWVDPWGPPPGIWGWIKLYWHDVAWFIVLGALALGLLLWSPVPYNKYFTVSRDFLDRRRDIDIINPEFANPKRDQYIPIIADALAAVFTPIVSIVLINFFGIGTYSGPGRYVHRAHRRGSFLFGRGSFWNVSNGVIGVVYAVMTGAVLQIIIKLAVPGLRPHFLTVCDPQIDENTPGVGYNNLYFTARVCRDYKNRESDIANAMQSFPSGHSVAAWAGMFFCSLYFNAHLKVFSNYHPGYWKFLLFVLPLCAATLMVGALSLDMSHNWYDIVAGSLIGVGTAMGGYRMVFASIFDYRYNHIPLKRGGPPMRYDEREMIEWNGGVATRRAGWGVPGGEVLGAPGDFLRGRAAASEAVMGSGAGLSTGNHVGTGDGIHHGMSGMHRERVV